MAKRLYFLASFCEPTHLSPYIHVYEVFEHFIIQ